MTSLALLQQGQRTQRETNQYDIECESGPSLMQKDEKDDKKKEGTDLKKETVAREREEKNWESKQTEWRKWNDHGGKGMASQETSSRTVQAMDERLETTEMEDRDEGPEGRCNLAGGSNMSLQQCHRHKHTSRYP